MKIKPQCSKTSVRKLKGFSRMTDDGVAVPIEEGIVYSYTAEEAKAQLAAWNDTEKDEWTQNWRTYIVIDDETNVDDSYTRLQVVAPDEESAILLGILYTGLVLSDEPTIEYHDWAPSMCIAGMYPGVLIQPLTLYTNNGPEETEMVRVGSYAR